ncbi:MAG: patatin-like phospholipase family protein [Pleomorphochaeta sp.]
MLLPSKKKEDKIEERYILCIDGGGMRGIVPAHIIAKLDEELKLLNEDRPLYSFFDLIAGTSTGGLIALGLTTSPLISNLEKEEGDDYLQTYEKIPLSFFEKVRRKKQKEAKSPKLITKGSNCSSLINFYKNDGKNIFHAESRFFGTLLKDKYDAKYIENFLSNTFQDARMNQCLVPTMVVSYDASEGVPFIFNSWDKTEYYVREAARATSAAPTYFSPSVFYDKKENVKRYLIDGGIIANNPVLLAYSEARKLYPNCKKFHILSLSTASNDYSMQGVDISGGLMGWIDPSKGAPIQKIASTAQMQLSSYVANNLSDAEFIRIHYSLKGDSFKLDDTSNYAINTLIDSAEQLFRAEKDKLTSFLKKLIKRDDFSHVIEINNLSKDSDLIKETEKVDIPSIVSKKYKEENIIEKQTENKVKIENTKSRKLIKKKTSPKKITTPIQDIINEENNAPLPNPTVDLRYQEILDKYGINDEDLK